MERVFGAKVSRKGFDVDTASDKQLAFSSEWPLLPIEAEGEFSVASGSHTYDIYTHNLGYYPVFSLWYEIGGKRYPMSGPSVLVTTSKLIYDANAGVDYTLHWKVYRRDLRKEFTSSILEGTDATETDSGDYGVVVSLPGKDVSSTDKRDFGIRSDVRQLMIHKSGYADDVLSGNITHNLGYKPMYWFYVESPYFPGKYYIINVTDDFIVGSSDTVLSWQLFTAPGGVWNWAYIIFKDPVNQVG